MAAALLQGLENRFGDDYFLIVNVLKYIREPLAQIGFVFRLVLGYGAAIAQNQIVVVGFFLIGADIFQTFDGKTHRIAYLMEMNRGYSVCLNGIFPLIFAKKVENDVADFGTGLSGDFIPVGNAVVQKLQIAFDAD